ncbi:hypothetical protein LINGRAPRIM_LOCUS3002 [Linum grandiflorum]
MLGDTYLTVHRWFREFDPWTTKITTTMVWEELPDLPIEFYNPVAVKRIASRIGKPFRVDRATEEGARGKFARVCIEVDLSKQLLPKYKVEGKTYLIVYKGFHKICTNCGLYGAPTHLCQCRTPQATDPMISDTEEPQRANDPSNGKDFGEWMMPKRKVWRRPMPGTKKDNGRPWPAKQGNLFDALNKDDATHQNSLSSQEEGMFAEQVNYTNTTEPDPMDKPNHEANPDTDGVPTDTESLEVRLDCAGKHPDTNDSILTHKGSPVVSKHSTDKQKVKIPTLQKVTGQDRSGSKPTNLASQKQSKESATPQNQSFLLKGCTSTDGAGNRSPYGIR